ncbi:MAG: DUF1330 domain-containing protein [Psychromonas sp.]
MNKEYFEPTQESGAALFKRNIVGEVVMLNLLRLRDVADYSNSPELSPESPISGKEAFLKYIDHTLPFLKRSGGELLMLGEGGDYFIGPTDEKWDLVMLIKQSSVENFFSFASDPECMAGIGHRTAAIADSRLLPIVENRIARKT